MIQEIIILRHAERLDTIDHNWKFKSPTPYDPPLSQYGFEQVNSLHFTDLSDGDVAIHSSPYLRCIQTSISVQSQLATSHTVQPIKQDWFLGEWLTPDYFSDISPPPQDTSLLKRTTPGLDLTWRARGPIPEYGETWSDMRCRFEAGLQKVLSYYNNPEQSAVKTLIFVTHGAGCNALIGAVLGMPMVVKVGLAAYVRIKKNPNIVDIDRYESQWEIKEMVGVKEERPSPASSYVDKPTFQFGSFMTVNSSGHMESENRFEFDTSPFQFGFNQSTSSASPTTSTYQSFGQPTTPSEPAFFCLGSNLH